MLCRACGVRLDPSIEGGYHPTCGPRRLEDRTTEKIQEIVRWADAQAERSQQINIGPSELGTNCDRFLAYRLVGAPTVNKYMDPWRAIVGTAIHAWLEKAVQDYQKTHRVQYETEVVVPIDGIISGHSDVFDLLNFAVLDYKTMTTTKLREFKKAGPQQQHIEQINMYAKGQMARGRTVKWVGIVAIPRDGTLHDFTVWIDRYDPAIAQRPLDRLYALAGVAMELDLEHNPSAFEQIPAAPSRLCGWCPFYRSSVSKQTADLGGCPGDSGSGDDKFAEGIIVSKDAQ